VAPLSVAPDEVDNVMEDNLRAPAEINEETWKDFDEILHAALSLPPALREMIAEHLLASLDGPNQKKVDAAWAEEIKRRMREIDEGKVEMIDGELVYAETALSTHKVSKSGTLIARTNSSVHK
jgi:putative addiction module component (TIGR02574 family)